MRTQPLQCRAHQGTTRQGACCFRLGLLLKQAYIAVVCVRDSPFRPSHEWSCCSRVFASGRQLLATTAADDTAILSEQLATGWSINFSGLFGLQSGSTQSPPQCITFPKAGVTTAAMSAHDHTCTIELSQSTSHSIWLHHVSYSHMIGQKCTSNGYLQQSNISVCMAFMLPHLSPA